MKVTNPMISYHSLEGGKSDRVMSIDVHPDVTDGVVVFGTVGGGGSGEIRLWSIAPGEEAPRFRSALAKGHEGSVNCARWAPDGSRLASAGDRGTVCLWRGGSDASWWCDLDKKQERARCDHLNHADDIYDVAWSPCGKWLLTGAIDGSATIWDTCTRRPVKVLRDHAHYIQGVCWDPCGNYVATASSDRSLKVYDLPPKWHASKKALKTSTVRWWTDPNELPPKKGKKASLPDEPKVKAANRSALFASETAHASFFRRLCASADGTLLIAPGAASKDDKATGAVTLHRAQLERGPVSFLPSPDGSATACRACPALIEGRTSSLVAVCAHDAVAVYDVAKNTPCAVAQGLHYAALTDAAWAADASLLIVASADGYLSFIRFEAGDLGETCVAPERVPPPAGLDDLRRRPPPPKADDEVVLLGVTPAPATPGGEAPPASPAGSAKKKKRIAPTLLSPPTPVKSPQKGAAPAPADAAADAPPAKKKKRIAPTLLSTVP